MPAKLTAVLGACKRQGRWKVSGQTNALVLFGHCYIDYREAYADEDLEKMKLKVTCLLGNATFIVPEGSDIQPSVVSLLAATAFDVPEVDVESPLPTLIIETTTVLGRCRVLTTPPAEAKDEEEAEQAEESLPDSVGEGIGRVDEIGGGAGRREADVALPPLEAVAKALLAEPGARAEAEPAAAPTELGIGLMPSREGKDGSPLGIGLGASDDDAADAPLGIGLAAPDDDAADAPLGIGLAAPDDDAADAPLGIGMVPPRDDRDDSPLGIGMVPPRDDRDDSPLGIGLGSPADDTSASDDSVETTSDAA